ncbi:MAG: hypothetical protein O9272_02455, partial [Brevundimonas sp.]|nr:hypothetical protein [Brevundimonas sp.]
HAAARAGYQHHLARHGPAQFSRHHPASLLREVWREARPKSRGGGQAGQGSGEEFIVPPGGAAAGRENTL